MYWSNGVLYEVFTQGQVCKAALTKKNIQIKINIFLVNWCRFFWTSNLSRVSSTRLGQTSSLRQRVKLFPILLMKASTGNELIFRQKKDNRKVFRQNAIFFNICFMRASTCNSNLFVNFFAKQRYLENRVKLFPFLLERNWHVIENIFARKKGQAVPQSWSLWQVI